MLFGVLIGFVLVSFVSATSSAEEAPTTNTPNGLLKGMHLISRNGKRFEAFLGVRFATVAARFENSVLESSKWEGTKDATKMVTCAQILQTSFGDEDCLFLNVFTPKADKKKRPVIVYIHGGGFNCGTTEQHGAKYYMDEDVVFVAITYRVGILGFLTTGDGVVSGNMGLRDQVQALRWVQQNIEAFGGDPSQVTIQGESAGGASVSFLTLSPLAKGLFHRVIAQSGAATNPWAFKENNLSNAVSIAHKLNCSTDNSKELVACLRAKTADELLVQQLTLKKFSIDPFAPFSPTLEIKNKLNPEPFLDRRPIDILKSGDFNRVPTMFIMMKDEGITLSAAMILRSEALRKSLDEEWSRIAPITFYYDEIAAFAPHIDDISEELREFYFGKASISLENEKSLVDLYTDALFLKGIHDTALLMAKHVPVYTGLFTHQRKDYSIIRFFGIQEVLGAAHGDDLAFLFTPVLDKSTDGFEDFAIKDVVEPKDVEMSKAFIQMVTSFAKIGAPKVPFANSPDWTPITKQEITTGELDWFNVGLEPFFHKNAFKSRMELWDRIYKKQEQSLDKEKIEL